MAINVQFSNFAATTLAGGISAGATSASLAVGTGALFPTLTGSQYFWAVLVDAATGLTKEIVKVTARTTDTVTITRAQEGTAASAFIAGDKFELRLTNQAINDLRNEPISDANPTLYASGDNTKKLAWDLSGITAGQTRTMTPPNAAATLAALNVAGTWTATQTFGDGNFKLSGATSGTMTVKAPAIASTYTATFPAATHTVAGLEVTETFTAPQRGTITTDNDLSFDLSVTNFFLCTPTGAAALTFTNIPTGQGGTIKLVNNSNYAITAAATTKVTSTFLTTVSATGTYIIHYFADGTNVYCSTAGAMA